MFKNKSTPNKPTSTVNDTSQKHPSLNVISEGTKIKGTITSQDDIRIVGEIDGEAICKGKIIVGPAAKLDGNLTSVDADIAGRVEGTIKVSNKLTLKETAYVGGDVYAKVLVVEEKAKLNGNCKTGSDSHDFDSEIDEKTTKPFNTKDSFSGKTNTGSDSGSSSSSKDDDKSFYKDKIKVK